MPRPDSARAALALYPGLAMATVAAFLLRARQIAIVNSPGSGITVAGSEVVMRLSALAHAAISIGEGALSILLRVALAPPQLAFAIVEGEFRVALGAGERV